MRRASHKIKISFSSVALSISFLFLMAVCPMTANGQTSQPALTASSLSTEVDQTFSEAAFGSFHRSVLVAMRKSVRAGKMKRVDALRVRVALLSPAYRKHAEDLAVTQMAFSGSDAVPLNDSGQVERAAIDWTALGDFIERLIPLLLQLLEIFGVT